MRFGTAILAAPLLVSAKTLIIGNHGGHLADSDFSLTDDGLMLFDEHSILPIITDSEDPPAVHIAVQSYVNDLYRLSGHLARVVNDTILHEGAVYVGTSSSRLIERIRDSHAAGVWEESQSPLKSQTPLLFHSKGLKGQWEAYDVRLKSIDGRRSLVLEGSDRRGVIYALYTLSEHMGVSPWHWWADVPVPHRDAAFFPSHLVISHGEPTVRYRGFFLNDEQPVLWNWAKDLFGTGEGPPFQVGMYERVFELLLRLKGNYLWPAMWQSMFALDGQDLSHGKPSHPIPGPNQLLAEAMGVVMGTSHHEPMATNQKEYTDFGKGPWDYTKNKEYLEELWTYGAERAKDLEVVWTVGMRGDGDAPYEGANGELMKNITAAQQSILRKVLGKKDLSGTPQMWAMYKEVMELFNQGLEIPPEVTPLFSDDNYGNLQIVLPENRTSPSGAGVYYHADYVGYPRSYKWINTVSLPKSTPDHFISSYLWEQMNIAKTFNMTEIWILNVGDLKMLEIPLEYFMNLGYDFGSTTREGLDGFLRKQGKRDFELQTESIMLQYTRLAARRKAELVDANTYSLVNFDEWDRVVAEWDELLWQAEEAYESISHGRRVAFEEMALVQIRLQANMHRMYREVASSNLQATQGRTSTNLHAKCAIELFERDFDLIDDFHRSRGGKWNHTLAQTHIGYQYWQMPVRNSLPPVSYISPRSHSFAKGSIVHTRFIPENSQGAWPGDNKHNNPSGHDAPDPTLLPMDPNGAGRWVEVASGGWISVNFTATSGEEWLIVEPKDGIIKGDGTTDTRVFISVDWKQVDLRKGRQGCVFFRSSDGSQVNVTVPVAAYEPPAKHFMGFLQGDGYVAMEAAHYTSSISKDEYAWTELPYLGRTHSGLTILPPSRQTFEPHHGPSVSYDFWIGSASEAEAEIMIHISPSLNFLSKLSFGVQLDRQDIVVVEPVPLSVEDDFVGFLPPDWQAVTADEIRIVRIPAPTLEKGKHTITIHGLGPGIVLQRIIVDLGGLKARSGTHLGPPESRRV